MILYEVLFGITGFFLMLIMAINTRQLLKNLEEHRDVSLANFFLHPRGLQSFEFLAFSGFLYTAGMVLVAVGMAYELEYAAIVSRIVVLAVLAVVTYFFMSLESVSRKPSQG